STVTTNLPSYLPSRCPSGLAAGRNPAGPRSCASKGGCDRNRSEPAMCGFVGILDNRGVDAAEVQRMAHAIAHRGPDDATTHLEPGLGLGFRRLSIIDLAGGRQPIPNEDESVWVMLNGEIYNYRTLRAGLVIRGHRFRTQSDTEVLVHLYEEHGA